MPADGSDEALARVGVIGDIHAEDLALSATLEFLVGDGVDAVLAVGDIVDGRGDVDRCVELLARHEAVVVAGNHERWLLTDTMRDLPDAHRIGDLEPRTLEYLRALPRTRRLATLSGTALLCHGLGTDDMGSLLPDDRGYALDSNTSLHRLIGDTDVKYVLNGHTHVPMVRRVHHLTVVNAGCLCAAQSPGFVVVDFENETVCQHPILPGYCVGPGRVRPLTDWTALF